MDDLINLSESKKERKKKREPISYTLQKYLEASPVVPTVQYDDQMNLPEHFPLRGP